MDLESFMEDNESRPTTSFIESLPEEVVAQLVNARLNGSGWVVMDRWLVSEGYTDSTVARIKNGVTKLIEKSHRGKS